MLCLCLGFCFSACSRDEAPARARPRPQPPETAPQEPATSSELGDETPTPELPPLPAAAVLDAEIRAARDAAQRRLLRESEPLQPDLPGLEQPLAEDALPGRFVPLEIPPGQAPLAPFEQALAALEAGTRSEPVRIALYGASGVAADKWTGYLRAYLQGRFGDGGPGMVAGAPPHKWSHHQEMELEGSSHWTLHNAWRFGRHTPPPATAPFGVMGEALSADHERAWSELRPHAGAPSAARLAYYEIHYLLQPGGGGFTALLDGRPVAELSSAGSRDAGPGRLGRHRIELELGRAPTLRMQLHGDGPVRLLGVVAETGEPGVVLDALGVNGAKTESMLRWDKALWAEQLKLRDPELFILAYGNNEAVDVDVPIADYERDYRSALTDFRATLPEAACLMVGPGDYPERVEGELRPRPRLARIRAVQRALAPEFGCAYLDTLAVFGGPGSKVAWVEAGLAKDDYLHLTRPGYLRFGLAVGDALMQRYDWRARHRGTGAL